MRGGIGVPLYGVEESRIIRIEEGPFAALVMDIEGSEGFSMSEHGGICVSGLNVICGHLD